MKKERICFSPMTSLLNGGPDCIYGNRRPSTRYRKLEDPFRDVVIIKAVLMSLVQEYKALL
jgi:hypothetical protein